MVNVFDAPVQPLAVGITVMVAVIGTLVILVAVKAEIMLLPEAPMPMDVLLLDQL